MHLIKNDFEYRSWMLEAYFRQDNIYGDTLLTEEEMEDILFDSRPQEYPCLGMVTPSKQNPLDSDIMFFYRNNINDWAMSMGLMNS